MKLPFVSRRRRDAQLEEEFESHLAIAAQEQRERGLSAEDAHAAAHREFGNVALVKEVTRQAWGWTWLERLTQDLRYAFRTLGKDKGFTLVAVLTLALGVGATTAIFSVFHGVVLQPLAYRDPGQLYGIWTLERGQTPGGESGPDLSDLHQQSKSFEQLGAALPFNCVFRINGEPKRMVCTAISPEIFPMLGVRPLLGREFVPEEYHDDNGYAILSYDFWQREFGGDPKAVGTNVNGLRVVGVMSRLPDFFPQTDAFVTLIPDFPFMHWRGNRFLRMFGRLKHEVSRAQAEQELTAILGRSPETPAGMEVRLSPMRDDFVGSRSRSILNLLMAAVGLVLLVASVNVATLLLARAESRRPEIDLRIMLGAGRMRLLRQLFTENLALAFLGGSLGILLATWLTSWLVRAGSDQLPRTQNVDMNLNVLVFTLLITVAASVMFGLAPSLALIRQDRSAVLHGGPRATVAMRRPRRNVLIVTEVGLSLALIIGTGLLMRSLWKVVHTDLGWEPEHLLATYMRMPDDKTVEAFYPQALEALRNMSGVQGAALGDCGPGMGNASVSLGFPDRAADPAHVPSAFGCWISADYFPVTGTPLLSGRAFTDHDNLDAPLVAIINQSMAKTYWPGQNPIGKLMSVGYLGPGRRPEGADKLRQVVGVVADVRRIGESAQPDVYLPYTQDETKHVMVSITLYVKTRGTADMAGDVKAKLKSLRDDFPVNVVAMESKNAQSLAPRRFTLFLLASFALLALVLAAIGIHGVVAYSVSRRTREIGIRMALGADRESVVHMVLKEVLRPVGIGLAAGGIAAMAGSRLINSMLYGTQAADPYVLIACVAIMLGVGLAAAWFPARRAATVNPIEALHAE